MPLQLTEQQRQLMAAQGGRPIEVIDPETLRTYVLIDREQFEKVRPMLDDPKKMTIGDAVVAIPPAVLRSQQAFWRELPELLKQRKFRRQWVCYRGDERIGTARDSAELYKICQKRGIERGEFYVGCIIDQPAPWQPSELEESLFETDGVPFVSSSKSP